MLFLRSSLLASDLAGLGYVFAGAGFLPVRLFSCIYQLLSILLWIGEGL